MRVLLVLVLALLAGCWTPQIKREVRQEVDQRIQNFATTAGPKLVEKKLAATLPAVVKVQVDEAMDNWWMGLLENPLVSGSILAALTGVGVHYRGKRKAANPKRASTRS